MTVRTPAQLVALWSPSFRLSSSLHRCNPDPTAVLSATEGGLPVLAYFYRTDRDELTRVRCVNVLSHAEPEGIYSTREARAFYRVLTRNGFKDLKGKADGTQV